MLPKSKIFLNNKKTKKKKKMYTRRKGLIIWFDIMKQTLKSKQYKQIALNIDTKV